MKLEDRDFFYCDERPGLFCADYMFVYVVRLSRDLYMVKSNGNYARAAYDAEFDQAAYALSRRRFVSYEEAALNCASAGLRLLSYRDFAWLDWVDDLPCRRRELVPKDRVEWNIERCRLDRYGVKRTDAVRTA